MPEESRLQLYKNLGVLEARSEAHGKRIDELRANIIDLREEMSKHTRELGKLTGDVEGLERSVRSVAGNPNGRFRRLRHPAVIGGASGPTAIAVWEAIKYLLERFN